MTMPEGILTVSLNAAVDVSYRADGFGAGKINIVSDVTRVAAPRVSSSKQTWRRAASGRITRR